MEKQNTPNYAVKYINDFKNFNPKKEKEELGKLRRQFKDNPDEAANLPVLTTMKFNKVTKTMQTLSKDEVIDKEKAAAEELKEDLGFATNIETTESFFRYLYKDINNHKEDIRIMVNHRIPKTMEEYNKLKEIEEHLEMIQKLITKK